MLNFTSMACERGIGEIDPGDRLGVYLEITSYLAEEPAKMHIDFNRREHAGVPVAAPLGDEAAILTQASSVATNGVVMIRKGRFVFEVAAGRRARNHAQAITAAAANAALVPAARQIMQTLGDQR